MTSAFTQRMAQTGLVAKGTVYVLLGLLAFMAAFEINGTSSTEATQSGVLRFVGRLPAGDILLYLVAAGLLCYCIWRAVQVYQSDNDKKGWKRRVRYVLSALGYLGLAYTAVKVAGGKRSSGDRNQQVVSELLDKPYGEVLVIIGGLIFAAVGAYQIYYGLSEKYRKHVQERSLRKDDSTLLLRSGKIGYVSRGIVWMVIAVLFLRAAFDAAASEAGNTGKAFRFIEHSAFGYVFLGGLGLGLAAYGVFNYVRARYEKF